MMGSKSFTIDAKDFLKGMSTSADVADGGFSPDTDAVNLTARPGVLYPAAQPADASTNLTGDMLASCEDSQTVGQDRFFLAKDESTGDGSYYYWNGTALTLKRTDSTNNYQHGISDMASYKGEVYATSFEAITRWVPDTVFNTSFFTFANANVPHPELVLEDNIFYGDKNLLLRQTAAGGATPSTILTLPVGQTIVALGIDPGSGLMLISITQALNSSDTIAQINKVGYYDGYSAKLRKVVIVDEMVTAFYNVSSVLYVFYGQNMGYWTGSGIQFLRKLDLTFDNSVLAYKNHVTNIGPTLYVIEKTKIIAHGPIQAGGAKVFYPAYKNNFNSNNITHIASIGQNKLGIGFKNEIFYTWDSSSIASHNTQIFYSNKYQFSVPIWLRSIRVFYKSSVSSNASPGNMYYLDDRGDGTPNILSLQNTSGAAEFSHLISKINAKMSTLQLRPLFDTVIAGIRAIEVTYDLAGNV